MSAFSVDPETMRKAVTAADAMHNGRKFEMAEVIVPESLRVGERDKALTELSRHAIKVNGAWLEGVDAAEGFSFGHDEPMPVHSDELPGIIEDLTAHVSRSDIAVVPITQLTEAI